MKSSNTSHLKTLLFGLTSVFLFVVIVLILLPVIPVISSGVSISSLEKYSISYRLILVSGLFVVDLILFWRFIVYFLQNHPFV